MTAPTTHACPFDLIELARRLADASGPVIRSYFRQPIQVDGKADASPVTAADREAEQAIRAILAETRPDDGIIGEEFGNTNTEAEYVWVIDPIDGTKSFISGRPIFGTLIALVRDGAPILGVIDQPVSGERWVGATGSGAEFNGTPVNARACPSLAACHCRHNGGGPVQPGPGRTLAQGRRGRKTRGVWWRLLHLRTDCVRIRRRGAGGGIADL
jgi:fructose-1,6-bisphosphatase/inositol monophosphatase family enzyme